MTLRRTNWRSARYEVRFEDDSSENKECLGNVEKGNLKR